MTDQPGMKTGYLREKRKELLQELHSDTHYSATETVAYGDHDPFDVVLCVCEKCGGTPILGPAPDWNGRWLVQCGCGNRVKQHRKRRWEALLDWRMINLSNDNYQDMPLFGLASLSAEDAHTRLVSIRKNLELRRKIVGLSRVIGQRTSEIPVPGMKYEQRLNAYLQWCMFGLRLTKLKKNANKR